MDQTFFLAANSGQGFFSLYDGFPDAGQYLHIIKGGPGTGKSGFMRRIRKEAQARGMDTVSILCSGDPDSLDGLAVPALHQAWVDGTAPHVREPGIFGADSDYVNLCRFCHLPLPREDSDHAQQLTIAYKTQYAAAYRFLSAAAELEAAEEKTDAAVDREEERRVRLILEALPDRVGSGCVVQKRFLSAVSCQGIIHLSETVNLLCKQIYYIRGSSQVLAHAAALGERKASRMIIGLSPLHPTEPEAVLLPETSAAFLRAPAAVRVPAGERRLSREALELAVQELREAKALHDELEAVYRPHMDFDALTAFADQYVEALFSDMQ